MKKTIMAFGASTSSTSINQAFVTYAASQLSELDSKVISLRDFDMPLFSVDVEKDAGFPENALKLHALVKSVDGIVISLAEHNGAYAAAFKSVFDWLSRLEGKAWDNKPMLLLATSPGGRGASSVLEMASNRFPFNGGNVIATFSLPQFYTNFHPENGISDPVLNADFRKALKEFSDHLASDKL
jgi:NAD(P)H-dependent FMN reductase